MLAASDVAQKYVGLVGCTNFVGAKESVDNV